MTQLPDIKCKRTPSWAVIAVIAAQTFGIIVLVALLAGFLAISASLGAKPAASCTPAATKMTSLAIRT